MSDPTDPVATTASSPRAGPGGSRDGLRLVVASLSVVGLLAAGLALAGGPWWLWLGGVLAAAAGPAAACAARWWRPPVRLLVAAGTAVAVVALVVVPWSAAVEAVGRGQAPIAGMEDDDVRWSVQVGDRMVLGARSGPRVLDLATGRVTRRGAMGDQQESGLVSVSAAGWVFVRNEPFAGTVVHDLRGRRLFERGPGDDESRSDGSDEPDVEAVAADGETAVLLTCGGDDPCTLEAVDRGGRARWSRTLGAGSWRPAASAGASPAAGLPGPDEAWVDRVWSPDDDTPAALRVDPDDGRTLERRTGSWVAVPSTGPRLELTERRRECLVASAAGGRRWRAATVASCSRVLDADRLGPTLWPSETEALDLRTGRVLQVADTGVPAGPTDPPRTLRGARPVQVQGSRAWVVDVATGRARWSITRRGGDGLALGVGVTSSASTVAVTHDVRSLNPFVRRSGPDDPGDTGEAVRVDIAGLDDDRPAHSCVLDAGTEVVAVVGTDRVLVGGSPGLRLVRCR